jgi:hypothetical protein
VLHAVDCRCLPANLGCVSIIAPSQSIVRAYASTAKKQPETYDKERVETALYLADLTAVEWCQCTAVLYVRPPRPSAVLIFASHARRSVRSPGAGAGRHSDIDDTSDQSTTGQLPDPVL